MYLYFSNFDNVFSVDIKIYYFFNRYSDLFLYLRVLYPIALFKKTVCNFQLELNNYLLFELQMSHLPSL